jgi:hypothetical protein
MVCHRALAAGGDGGVSGHLYPYRLSPGDVPWTGRTVLRYRRLITQTGVALVTQQPPPHFYHGTSARTARCRRRENRHA